MKLLFGTGTSMQFSYLDSICPVFDKKASKTRLSKFLKQRSLLFVNDCFRNESNAVFGVFLQRLDRTSAYHASEILYLQSEISQAGDITSLAFYKAGQFDTEPIADVSIYLRHTTSSSLSNGTSSTGDGYQLVFSGTFPNNLTSGWMQVEFSNNFAYNNTENLQILILKGFQQPESIYPPLYRYTNTASPMFRRYSGSQAWTSSTNMFTSNFRPNIKLEIHDTQCYTPTGLTASNITSTSADLSWTETGSANLWDIELLEASSEGTGTPSVSGISQTSYTYSDLSPKTEYKFYVRSDCGDSNYSNWAGPYYLSETLEEQVPAWSLFGTEIQEGQFIGSTNEADFVFKTNNLERMRLTKDGSFQIGTEENNVDLNVMGGIRFNNIAAPNNVSLIEIDFILPYWLNFGYCGPEGSGIRFFTGKECEESGASMSINNGKVGIGTDEPDFLLDVAGIGRFCEVRVEVNDWCDYVFEDDYKLMSLQDLEQFIITNKHLPEVPSESQAIAEGIGLGEFSKILLKKIEKLTLYLIEQEKKIGFLNEEIERIKESYK